MTALMSPLNPTPVKRHGDQSETTKRQHDMPSPDVVIRGARRCRWRAHFRSDSASRR
jgi:hypothetical protein